MPSFERKGQSATVYSRQFPDIIGGICEFCGVRNNLQPSEVQYQLGHVPSCPYSSIGGTPFIRCSYCPENSDPVEVIKHAKFSIHQHPDRPDELIAVCDSYNCSQKHLARFNKSI